MMTDIPTNFHAIAEKLEILIKKLRGSTNPEERRALLRQFRALLADADEISAEEDS
jgi:hypothetical protein